MISNTNLVGMWSQVKTEQGKINPVSENCKSLICEPESVDCIGSIRWELAGVPHHKVQQLCLIHRPHRQGEWVHCQLRRIKNWQN
jgi:hypothetical protein